MSEQDLIDAAELSKRIKDKVSQKQKPNIKEESTKGK